MTSTSLCATGFGRPRAAAVVGLGLAAALAMSTAASAGGRGSAWTSTAHLSDGSAWTTAAHLDPALSTVGDAAQRVIVSGRAGAAAVASAVQRLGGTVGTRLDIVDGVEASVPASKLVELSHDPAVGAVTMNRSMHYEEYTYDETTTASNFAKNTQATSAWAAGNLGAGVGVAVIDTGIAAMNDFGGRVVYGPDLSGEGSTLDSYGHGTVMAGAIGGGGQDSAGQPGGAYTGVAPKATLVSVKVAGRNGVADVSTILQAMHWVSAYKDQFNIRVMNLSWGTPSTQDPSVDPLNYAVERLWKQGIVVVVAAGNSGPNATTITKPGDDPVVITAGAFDDKQDLDASNDSIPAWASRGPTAQGVTKPDLVVPGRTIITARAYGSKVEADNPKALIGKSYIKGSGTSQAAAITSGLAALLVSAKPSLTPDQVKAALKGTALPLAATTANNQGNGRVQLAAALAAAPTTATQATPATGLGPIEGSRGGLNVTARCNGIDTVIRGEIDVRCEPWAGSSWTGSSWTGSSWTGSSWTGSSWTGSSWTGGTWTGSSWTGSSWTGSSWTGSSWTGSSWTGSSWTGSSWTGSSWTGSSWT
ncbi:MAG: S8 family serine peptidase, partial [Actinobacteria bacterium]|nr:S8 family serine peptidase [Actinomycetota bacterium]